MNSLNKEFFLYMQKNHSIYYDNNSYSVEKFIPLDSVRTALNIRTELTELINIFNRNQDAAHFTINMLLQKDPFLNSLSFYSYYEKIVPTALGIFLYNKNRFEKLYHWSNVHSDILHEARKLNIYDEIQGRIYDIYIKLSKDSSTKEFIEYEKIRKSIVDKFTISLDSKLNLYYKKIYQPFLEVELGVMHYNTELFEKLNKFLGEI